MRFLDEAVIWVRSGDGGRGCVSFRRERFVPRGGPDGGDGGRGGDVYIRASEGRRSLGEFSSRRLFRAEDGRPGAGSDRSGRDGRDVIIQVPPGTLVKDEETGEILGDLIRAGQEVLAARGGRGGKGNRRFATPTNRAPREAQPGLPGRERKLRLVLKNLAQVGLIGLPNAGKSTLLSRLTTAEPKIADYPFTTLTPNLGVISFEDGASLTVADIPGLIQGAGAGKGLGHTFLKHIERTGLLLHLLDMTEPAGGWGLLEDFEVMERELSEYEPGLLEKERVVLLNKMDARDEAAQRDPEEMKEALEGKGFKVFPVSALTGEGLDAVEEFLHGKAVEWTEVS